MNELSVVPADARQPRPRVAPRQRNRLEGLQMLAHIPIDTRKCWTVLEVLIKTFNHQHTLKEKDVSYKTQMERANLLRLAFRQLVALGYHLDPRSLGTRHVQALVNHWVEQKISLKTMQTYLSFLRAFCDWIGKPGMIRPAEYFIDKHDRAKTGGGVATRDKSWFGAGVDVEAKIADVARTEPHVALQLSVMYAFGLRVKETLMMLPHQAVVGAAETGIARPTADRYLCVERGTKGGRRRYVPLDSDDKRQVLELAQAATIAPDGHLGFAGLPLKETMKKFRNRMAAHGITLRDAGIVPHGLRHQFAHARYAEITGVLSPVQGGTAVDKALDTQARLAVSAVLGHRRKQIASAYLGGLLRSVEGRAVEQTPG